MSAAERRPPPRPQVELAELVRMLQAQADVLARELLPGGIREGHEYRCGSLAGDKGRSLAVHLGNGSRRGVWSDFSTGETGDALDLVAQVLFRGDKGQAVTWARRWLGIDSGDPALLEQRRREVKERQQAALRAPEEEEERRKAALRIFLAAEEKLAGTPVDLYLRGRGIDLSLLARQPRSIRYHPRLWNAESKRFWPAMVAAIVNHEGVQVAVHRTWLEPPVCGRVGKAPLQDPKLTLGTYRGGAIRLWRGAGARRLADEKPGAQLTIGEGIEDCLSAAVAAPERRIWAAVSLSNMGALQLPPAIGSVVILAQNDTAKEAIRGLDRATSHFLAQGKAVLHARSPVGKDINDLLRGGA